MTIDGHEFLHASGDDGLHSDSALTINGGDLDITKSYGGIESEVFMINGGYIAVDALGDGLDINGPIDMTGGLVLVNGPTANNDGALDYANTFNLTGGLLVVVGSSGMAQAPSASSTQYSVMYTFPSTQTAGTLVHIETEDGEDVLTFVPTKENQSVVFSSPDLQNGSTYVVYSGGSSTGTVIDGLYSGGTYTSGTQVDSFTISSVVTGAGVSAGGFLGGGDGGPGGASPRHT